MQTFNDYLAARGLCPGRIAAMPERVRALYLRGYQRQLEGGYSGIQVLGIQERQEPKNLNTRTPEYLNT